MLSVQSTLAASSRISTPANMRACLSRAPICSRPASIASCDSPGERLFGRSGALADRLRRFADFLGWFPGVLISRSFCPPFVAPTARLLASSAAQFAARPRFPRQRTFYCRAKGEDADIVKMAPHDLQSDRAAVAGRADRHRRGRQTGEVCNGGERRAARTTAWPLRRSLPAHQDQRRTPRSLRSGSKESRSRA